MSTIRFPENNRILYGQDFTIKCGVPHDVEFKVVRVDSSYMVLEGPGYGGKPYGNGRIYVYFRTKEAN